VVRRYDDTIDVRLQDGPGPDESGEQGEQGEQGQRAQPAAFVWRGRLYVVRAVQTRWYERRAWWREAAAAALLGLRGDDRAGAGPATEVPGGDGAAGDYLDGETEVWRVEASAGRSGPVGVFDLARSVPALSTVPAASTVPTVPTVAATGWRLTRVAD
jgi:hypothetical protein